MEWSEDKTLSLLKMYSWKACRNASQTLRIHVEIIGLEILKVYESEWYESFVAKKNVMWLQAVHELVLQV